MTASKPGIYIHIPFCVRKCSYCSFLSGPSDEQTRENYVKALVRELSSYKNQCKNIEFDTVYFGGGTPTVLSSEQLKRVLETVYENFSISDDSEITVEANPGTVDEEKLKTLKAAGFNRLSMGVQSMNDERLMFLGRIHSAAEVEADYKLAREAGFDNINLDLITAVPGMTLEDAMADIDALAALGPEHISMYTLQLEEGTPLHRLWEAGNFEIVDDETDRLMYHEGVKRLAMHGYERYEISNFAREQKVSRHNSKYWNMTDYLGCGLGASGYLDGVRYVNTSSMEEYSAGNWVAESEVSTEHDRISEAVFTGLRRRDGIIFNEICDDFWGYYAEVREEVETYARDGYVVISDDGMKLTDLGIDISNRIMALFV